jgi:hypothetical protein
MRPFETSVHTRSTRRHFPENAILHSHRRENLKSYLKSTVELLIPSLIRSYSVVPSKAQGIRERCRFTSVSQYL